MAISQKNDGLSWKTHLEMDDLVPYFRKPPYTNHSHTIVLDVHSFEMAIFYPLYDIPTIINQYMTIINHY